MTPPPARSAGQRRHDTLHRLEHDVDAWVATADGASGRPYLVPLSFLWNGSCLLFSTPAASPTRPGADPRPSARGEVAAGRQDRLRPEDARHAVPVLARPPSTRPGLARG
ncbi:hypothetical protein GCM10010279_20170 [Streptomyces mutabilis]|nr:hypothetical protein GCM10010279_20170 [Streptomyces mutabilis]